MKEFDNYIFDMYGTLVDIHTVEEDPALWEKGAEYLKCKFGTLWTGKELEARYRELTRQEERKLAAEIGMDYPETLIEKIWLELIKDGQLKAKDEAAHSEKELTKESPELLTFCNYFRETSRTRFKLFDGVLETFEILRSRGKKIFLLSNAQRAYTEKELSDLGLLDKFDDIFISSDKQIKKPQKEFLEQLISKNNLLPENCVMIGNDIFSDVGVACKNGINSIFLNTDGYSKKKIDDEIRQLGIKGSCLMPVIIEDGDIRRIL